MREKVYFSFTIIHRIFVTNFIYPCFYQKCLWGASGMDGSTEYQSMIVYHHNSPSWMETIRLAVPIDKFYGSHVRLEYRHCSSKNLLAHK